MSIPKIIHYCWLGGAPKPDSVMRCIESWKKHCPDYEIREWNETNLDISINEYTRQAYEAKAWGFVPDYLRLWIVYNYGGIYLDTDVQIVRSFDPLLCEKGFAGFERGTADENGFFVAFGLGFGAVAKNPVLKKHMDLYDSICFRNDDGTLNRLASPHYTTSVLVECGLDRKQNTVQELEYITIYPDDRFCPKSFATGIVQRSKNTYSIHQFDGSWYSVAEQEQRQMWEKEARRDYWLHFPHRIGRKILGNTNYEKLKRLFKK